MVSDDDFEDTFDVEEPAEILMGPCCVCGRAQDPSVRTIVMLDFRAPPGFIGWGCVVCDLPAIGATAIVCDVCVDAYEDEVPERLKWIQGGQYATQGIRVPLDGFPREPHGHDLSKHERAGMAWWNGLTVRDRARWFKIANTCVVAEAYDCYIALLAAFDGANDDDPQRHPFFGDEWDFGMLQP